MHKLESIKLDLFVFIQFRKFLCITGTLGSYLACHIISNFSAQESFLMLGLLQLYGGYPFNIENDLFLKAYFCCTEASTKMSVKSCGMTISHIKSFLKFYRSLWLTNTACNSRGVGVEGQASLTPRKAICSPMVCGTAQVSVTHLKSHSRPQTETSSNKRGYQLHQIGENLLSKDF